MPIDFDIGSFFGGLIGAASAIGVAIWLEKRRDARDLARDTDEYESNIINSKIAIHSFLNSLVLFKKSSTQEDITTRGVICADDCLEAIRSIRKLRGGTLMDGALPTLFWMRTKIIQIVANKEEHRHYEMWKEIDNRLNDFAPIIGDL